MAVERTPEEYRAFFAEVFAALDEGQGFCRRAHD